MAIPTTKIPKLVFFKEVKELGDRWMSGDTAVIEDLVAMQRPKGCLYPAAVHRYIVKEQGFPAGSMFITQIMGYTCV